MRITVDVEVNEALMSIATECMSTMPKMMKKFREEKKK